MSRGEVGRVEVDGLVALGQLRRRAGDGGGRPRRAQRASGAAIVSAARDASSVARAVVACAVVVGDRAQDVEVRVEVDVDLAAVGARDLDLVRAFLVADFGLGDLAAAGVRERRGARRGRALAR